MQSRPAAGFSMRQFTKIQRWFRTCCGFTERCPACAQRPSPSRADEIRKMAGGRSPKKGLTPDNPTKGANVLSTLPAMTLKALQRPPFRRALRVADTSSTSSHTDTQLSLVGLLLTDLLHDPRDHLDSIKGHVLSLSLSFVHDCTTHHRPPRNCPRF